jgi:transcriptional regulator with XRE-family HTH domain
LREIGRRIRLARESVGLTQEEAAGRSRIDYKRWQRIELGSVNVTVRTLLRVAATLDKTIWELLADR